MITIIAVFFARMLDPAAIIICAGLAPFFGAYRIAVPIGAAVYALIMLNISSPVSASNIVISALAGATLAAAGLFLWRLVPPSLKKAMTKE